MNTPKGITGLALAAISTVACVHDEDVQLDDEISTIIWDPGSEIVARHATWHRTTHPGDEFLDFHAQILVDLRAAHVAAGRAASERELVLLQKQAALQLDDDGPSEPCSLELVELAL